MGEPIQDISSKMAKLLAFNSGTDEWVLDYRITVQQEFMNEYRSYLNVILRAFRSIICF